MHLQAAGQTQDGSRHSHAGGNGRQSGDGGNGGYSWPIPRNAAQAAMNAFSGTQRARSGDGGEARKQR